MSEKCLFLCCLEMLVRISWVAYYIHVKILWNISAWKFTLTFHTNVLEVLVYMSISLYATLKNKCYLCSIE